VTIQFRTILVAVATAAALAAGPALAGGPGHGGGGCGGCGGGHQPQPPHHGGGNFNYNVNVNAQASAHASASAAAYSAINARGWSGHDIQRGHAGGGTFYGGGGYAEGGYGGWIPTPVPVQFYGPAPVSAPFGYAAYGFGRAYHRGPYYIPTPPPIYVDRREARRFEDSSYRYEESAAYEERWSGGSEYHQGGWASPPPPCDCGPAPESYREPYREPGPAPYQPPYPSPTEIPYTPAPPTGDYYGDFPEHIPYAQEPGERG